MQRAVADAYKVLIVEDDAVIAALIAQGLTKWGYAPCMVEDFSDVMQAFHQCRPQLVLLDIALPYYNGYYWCTEIRRRSDVPVLFISSRTEDMDIVMAMQMGGDDYIVKPFSNMELLMRVKAILRRSSGAKVPVVTEEIPFADLILDTESRSVSRQGEMIPLTYTEFQILELLVTHKKKIYSLENIYQSIWGEDAVGDSAIMVHIKNIRKKLGDDSRNPKYIKTGWGRGYYVDQ